MPLRGTTHTLNNPTLQSLPLPSISHFQSMSAAAAPSAASQSASPAASQSPPSSFSHLPPNRSQQVLQVENAPVADAHMLSQSLTQLLPAADTSAARQHFLTMPAVQQRLTAACDSFNAATTALQNARAGREHFVSIGSKQGGAKQLPAKLDWKLCKAAHFSLDSVPANFYATDVTTLRAIEREATDKAYDALLAAKDKHIAFLQARCVLRDFVSSAVQEFRPELQRIAADYNSHSQADPAAPSQAQFTFPTDAVASHFASELLSRLTAQTLARVDAQRLEQQRISDERAQEHKSQEIVLAGAHTGQTIAMLAQQEVNKQMAPLLRQVAQLQQQLQQPQPPPPRQRGQPNHHSRQQHPDASSSAGSAAKGPQRNSGQRDQSRQTLVVVKQAAAKRARSNEDASDDDIEHQPRTVSFADTPTPAPKRRKPITVTLPSKNGAGGDRRPRSDLQPPRSSKQADAPHRRNANKQGRGPRSDAQQQPQHQ